MKLSMIEGIFYALMVGTGEAYFVADAVRLGASVLAQGLIVTLPLCVGALGPLLTLAVLARWHRRKPVVGVGAFLQAAVLGVMAVADWTGSMTPALLITLACIYQVCAQAVGTAWSSWYGDLVPPAIRGRYFARRNRGVHLATCTALVISGLLLQHLEPGAAGAVAAGAGGLGFAVIFALATAARVASAALLVAAPEPPLAGMPDARATMRMLRAAEALPVRRLLGVTFFITLLVQVSAPYFAPFMLQGLHLSYLAFTAGNVVAVLMKFVSLPAWGRGIDLHGSRAVYLLTAVLIGIVPLPWVWAEGVAWVIAAQMLSGFAWGGYEVAHFTVLLETTEARTRPHVFAALNTVNGTAQLLGSLAGAAFLGVTGSAYQLLFAVSMLGRLFVALCMPRMLPADAVWPHIGRRRLLLRVIGLRPSGGVGYRPFEVEHVDDNRPAP